jgi:hypothetical protein
VSIGQSFEPFKRPAASAREVGDVHRKQAHATYAHARTGRWREAYPAEFKDGAKLGFTGIAEGPREKGGYPKGFHGWPLERRNGWFAGFNAGYTARERQ